jgi:hypothetical protein
MEKVNFLFINIFHKINNLKFIVIKRIRIYKKFIEISSDWKPSNRKISDV